MVDPEYTRTVCSTSWLVHTDGLHMQALSQCYVAFAGHAHGTSTASHRRQLIVAQRCRFRVCEGADRGAPFPTARAIHAALLRWGDESHDSTAGSQEEQGTDHGCYRQIKRPHSWFSLECPLKPVNTRLLSFVPFGWLPNAKHTRVTASDKPPAMQPCRKTLECVGQEKSPHADFTHATNVVFGLACRLRISYFLAEWSISFHRIGANSWCTSKYQELRKLGFLETCCKRAQRWMNCMELIAPTGRAPFGPANEQGRPSYPSKYIFGNEGANNTLRFSGRR